MNVLTVGSVDREKKSQQIQLDKLPDKCPVCHHGVDAKNLNVCYLNENLAQYVLVCPLESCQRIFIALYYRGGIYGGSTYRLYSVTPTEPRDQSFSEIIGKISTDFVLIFNQAHKAEQFGWTLVAGPGYRKALEFLIKDYLVFLDPESTKAIEGMQLSNCIANRVKSTQIQTTAERAVWLGNDETHYVRKWVDKDLSDHKTLIDMTVRWIEIEEMTKDILKVMPDDSKSKEGARAEIKDAQK